MKPGAGNVAFIVVAVFVFRAIDPTEHPFAYLFLSLAIAAVAVDLWNLQQDDK